MVIDSPKIDNIYEETLGHGTIFNNAVTVLPVADQLTLGGAGSTFATKITCPTPAAARTYTILDAGAAANFVMSSGTGLTSGRVPYVTTGGILTDSVSMKFDTTNGLILAAGSTSALQLPSTAGTLASGILFGTDTSLVRNAATSLYTNGAFQANLGFKCGYGYGLVMLMGVPGKPTGTPSGSGGSIAGGTYYYIVTAVDANGVSTTKGTESDAVVVPGGGAGSVSLTWTAVQGAVNYLIYRTTVSGTYTGSTYIGATAGGATTYLDTRAAPAATPAVPTSNLSYATAFYTSGTASLGCGTLVIASYQGAGTNGSLVLSPRINDTLNTVNAQFSPVYFTTSSAALKVNLSQRCTLNPSVALTNGLTEQYLLDLSLGAGASLDAHYGLRFDKWTKATANYPIYFDDVTAGNTINWGTTCALGAVSATALALTSTFQILATTNQLQLGTTAAGAKAITITAPAPAASRTYTVLDAGADANFVLSEGTATINGAKTFGNDTTHSANIIGASTTTVYLGATGTDGSWSMSRSGNNLIFQRRESGVWVTKGTITA